MLELVGPRLAVAAFAGAAALAALGCTFSPQTAHQAGSAVAVQRVEVTAKSWEYSSPVLLVKAGTPVDLVATSIDVLHGIELPDLNVPVEYVGDGRKLTARFLPDKPGVYNFRCSVACGEGHSRMWGLLIVHRRFLRELQVHHATGERFIHRC